VRPGAAPEQEDLAHSMEAAAVAAPRFPGCWICLKGVAHLRPSACSSELLLIIHVDRHELVVVGLSLVNRLQVGSKG
jgi:hypothetical protein